MAFALAAAAILAVAAFFVANRIDEALDPAAASYYASGRPPPLVKESGFAWVIGFAAPADREPPEYAVFWSQAMAYAAQAGGRFPVERNPLEIRAADELLCRPEKFDCAAAFGANPRAIDELVADNAAVLGRYAALQAQEDLADAGVWASFDAPLPPFRPLLDAHSAWLSRVAARAAKGEAGAALADLEADAAFLRRWMTQARVILSKMVVVRAISRDVLLALQIARRAGSLDSRAAQSLRRIFAPLTPAERSISAAMRFEAALLLEFLDRILASDRAARRQLGAGQVGAQEELALLFTLRNATLNWHHATLLGWESVDASETREVAEGARAQRERQAAALAPGWRWFRNPGGRLLLAEWSPDFERYILRVRDLDALVRLACAAGEVRLAGVRPDQVPGHLASAVPGCHDPYEDRPMAWDEQARTLSFAPRSAGTVARFGGAGGRVALSPY